ncbi:MAG: hypothetical protein ACD_17C00221G0006 [uncultured bacterium]|nr:MAG: hypothetical protein ACD_17C00221G0006 [uncultured bacterium]OGN55351.1 MAG: hypothetical protein A2796_02320 [Chlamydiae bacterium RIFCSPHIGHO2_01_FULL_44_39]OGN59854.1 MAG: hypothetical protein A3D96_03635 [Chlamydiae bacterium RIFCSPHIGHO2_12_FULL_44_59]OGN66061.1 MAG: hypothetical protein A2978_04150 [Chlamydiae bacterium RIFCSPLOWO2_01_FULL_44_52]OGN68597.1 MAG: hypothetical protein A3I67_02475 [Chlamydiae bacterium RIFCSPLOWO2_02_FULL_45_22]OGN69709.1 MAG: hypothetical protein A3
MERIEGYFLRKTPLYYAHSAACRFGRFSELYLGWMPLNFFAVVAQHEVFGHGYRIRDINRGRVKAKGYFFDLPPPYGRGGGATSYDISDALTTTEETSIAMAGVESTAILALQTKFKWLEARRIDPRQAVLYLLSQHDLNLYIGTLDIVDEEEGHDIRMYIQSLNLTYTRNFLNKGRLRSLSWMNLGDPFTLYAIYSWFRYVACGKETHIPMIPIYGWNYLCNIRLGLTPFGPEVFLENYLVKGKKPIYFYMKGGKHSGNFYGGFGMYAAKFWKIRHWHIGFRLDGFKQPKLLIQSSPIPFTQIDFKQKPSKKTPLYSTSEQHSSALGWGGSLIFSYSKGSGGEVEIGLKSMGFIPGTPLRASPIARLFYTLSF